MSKRLLHIYTGSGKGKTTAATGLILRALGYDWRVLLVRFLKSADPDSGEVRMLRKLDGIDIIDSGLGGIYDATDAVAVAEDVRKTFEKAKKALVCHYDLAVFDEFNGLFRKDYLPLSAAFELLENRPVSTELILTGRYAPDELIARADLVTSMDPCAQGVAAREGIEF